MHPYAAPYALCVMLMAAHTSRFHGRERVVVVVCVVVLVVAGEVQPLLLVRAIAWEEP